MNDEESKTIDGGELIIKSSNVIVPRQHQSAPKEHWSTKELQKAAEEISAGQYIVKPDNDELFNYGPTQALAQHPRVQEALARLELEKNEAQTTQEFVEKIQQQHELNARAAEPDKWDGQGRWIGKENEEMRHGLLLTPLEFMHRLTQVIGHTRVELNRYAVNKRVALLVPDPQAVASNLIMPFTHINGKCIVATLQYPLGTEWMIMRFNQYGVPTEAKFLGWRTALLSMILSNVITEKEAHKAFPLTTGPAADWYKQQLQIHRNNKGSIN